MPGTLLSAQQTFFSVNPPPIWLSPISYTWTLRHRNSVFQPGLPSKYQAQDSNPGQSDSGAYSHHAHGTSKPSSTRHGAHCLWTAARILQGGMELRGMTVRDKVCLSVCWLPGSSPVTGVNSLTWLTKLPEGSSDTASPCICCFSSAYCSQKSIGPKGGVWQWVLYSYGHISERHILYPPEYDLCGPPQLSGLPSVEGP